QEHVRSRLPRFERFLFILFFPLHPFPSIHSSLSHFRPEFVASLCLGGPPRKRLPAALSLCCAAPFGVSGCSLRRRTSSPVSRRAGPRPHSIGVFHPGAAFVALFKRSSSWDPELPLLRSLDLERLDAACGRARHTPTPGVMRRIFHFLHLFARSFYIILRVRRVLDYFSERVARPFIYLLHTL
ncbi:hypothetical protein GGX14DRAFT_643602, partial [Mycena pura]